ncbi:hypothetical protein HaLaN_03762 [Haematococcus lacustris]|uniref:Uncharacterized protein n=1 Tax=Haematococcus lacustris TaxID=44745 RepID=A0A699YHQ7_HAELA|nr:hypothetical protein HaLaN_03762 [Haematococcus lacustris]
MKGKKRKGADEPEEPNSGKPTDRVPGKVPCEEELDRSKPTRLEGWKPPAGGHTEQGILPRAKSTHHWVSRSCETERPRPSPSSL